MRELHPVEEVGRDPLPVTAQWDGRSVPAGHTVETGYGYWRSDGRFVLRDGRNRYAAALMLGMEFLFVAWLEPARPAFAP